LRTLLGQSLSLNLQSFIKFGRREFHLGDFASIIHPLGSILVGLYFLHQQRVGIHFSTCVGAPTKNQALTAPLKKLIKISCFLRPRTISVVQEIEFRVF
jgi:hypothetical protein